MAIAVLMFTFPSNFPALDAHQSRSMFHSFSLKSLGQVDFLGTALLLGASIFVVTGLQQVEFEGEWASATTIALLACSGPLYVVFLLWERRITSNDSRTEPVFPWRFAQSRLWIGIIM